MTPFMCRGCQQPIMERYLMKVLDKSWHMQCVKCCECQCMLNEKCYSRDSKFYCRNDFFKIFGTKCSGCKTGLCPEDLVRHALNKVYHVPCFACSMCRKQLGTGEQVYLVQGEAFLCERCYQLTQSIAVAKNSAAPSPVSSNSGTQKPVVETPSPQLGIVHSPMTTHHHVSTPVQPSGDGRRSKTRTSINPQQLEILMQTYSHEQRPSKQTREELMAKTGLDMKVIQVWFQNRRSKEKRDASYREAKEESAGASSGVTMMPSIATPSTVLPPQLTTTTPPGTNLPISSVNNSPPVSKPSVTPNGQENAA